MKRIATILLALGLIMAPTLVQAAEPESFTVQFETDPPFFATNDANLLVTEHTGDLAGWTCSLTVEVFNDSRHNTDLIVRTGGTDFYVEDVENVAHFGPHVLTTGITLGEEISVFVIPHDIKESGRHKGMYVSSIEGFVEASCEQPPETTTTTTPETTTTTTPETTTTVPDTTTTTAPSSPTASWECGIDGFNLFLTEGDWQVAGLDGDQILWTEDFTVFPGEVEATGFATKTIEFRNAQTIIVMTDDFIRELIVENCPTTTTTVPETTTTSAVPVTTTVPGTTPSTLPFTGLSSGGAAGFALVAGLAGAGVLWLTRGKDEEIYE